MEYNKHFHVLTVVLEIDSSKIHNTYYMLFRLQMQ